MATNGPKVSFDNFCFRKCENIPNRVLRKKTSKMSVYHEDFVRYRETMRFESTLQKFSEYKKISNFAQAPTKKTIIFFPCAGGKKYSIALSANEIVECNRLKNKTNTVKYRCEKSKCRVAIE